MKLWKWEKQKRMANEKQMQEHKGEKMKSKDGRSGRDELKKKKRKTNRTKN